MDATVSEYSERGFKQAHHLDCIQPIPPDHYRLAADYFAKGEQRCYALGREALKQGRLEEVLLYLEIADHCNEITRYYITKLTQTK